MSYIKYFNGLDAPVKLPLGFSVSFVAKSQRAKAAGLKKTMLW